MLYLKSRVFPEKSFLYIVNFYHNMFWKAVINDRKALFDIAVVLKMNIPYFQHSLNICYSLKLFFPPLSIFVVKEVGT